MTVCQVQHLGLSSVKPKERERKKGEREGVKRRVIDQEKARGNSTISSSVLRPRRARGREKCLLKMGADSYMNKEQS